MNIISRKSGQPVQRKVGADLVTVSIEVEGTPLPIYSRPGDGMPFVAAPIGKPFDILVLNRSRGRVEVVSTVDGRDTLDNLPGEYFRNRGMVVRPGEVWRNTGWRLNNQQTGRFVFSDPSQSVEARATGSVSNGGVFGFAVFQERPGYYSEPQNYRGATRGGGNFDSREAMTKGMGDLGTGMGNTVLDPVGSTEFVRQNDRRPDDLITMFYASEQWLLQNGIIVPPDPEPFPAMMLGTTGYAAMQR